MDAELETAIDKWLASEITGCIEDLRVFADVLRALGEHELADKRLEEIAILQRDFADILEPFAPHFSNN